MKTSASPSAEETPLLRRLHRPKLIRHIRRLKRTASLDNRDLLLCGQAWITLVCVRMSLWTFPARRVLSWTGRLARRVSPRDSDRWDAERIAWSVRALSRVVPRATCLTQSLTAHILLGRQGHDSVVMLGVAMDDDRGFEAHAWVEVDGKALIGADQKDRFHPMADLRTLL